MGHAPVLTGSVSRWWERGVRAAVARGLPPSWTGYRWVPHVSVQAYFARRSGLHPAERYETVHPAAVATNPLPCNVSSREELPADRGWWGYSFRDVPARMGGETFVATLRGCRVVWYRDPEKGNDFYPAIVAGDGHAVNYREVRFRPRHADALRRAGRFVRLPSATWVLERVYHNHSHWLTAHLPKLLLLRGSRALAETLLPSDLSPAIEASLRTVGLHPEEFPRFREDVFLHVDALTIVGTDRFRPELLKAVPDALGVTSAPTPWRRVLISRQGATRRRLVNEDDVWAVVKPAGFERVRMEDLSFDEQLALMRETAVLLAPHGAGLTNMLFCPPGAHVAEIADASFPNPNFYALASALGHHYWVIWGEPAAEGRPLDRDLRVARQALESTLDRILARTAA